MRNGTGLMIVNMNVACTQLLSIRLRRRPGAHERYAGREVIDDGFSATMETRVATLWRLKDPESPLDPSIYLLR